MDKKTMAYMMIGGAILAAAYYLYTKSKKGNLGAGQPDTRGAWAAEDDALYQRFRSQISYDLLNWIDPLAEERYNNGNVRPEDKIQGKMSKAGTFAATIYSVAPNPNGKYPPVHWDPTKPSLFDSKLIEQMYMDFAKLKVKYGGL